MPAAPFRHLLVTTDFSECSDVAVERAIELAEALGTRLTLVHVWQIPGVAFASIELMTAEYVDALQAAATKAMHDLLEKVRQRVPEARSVVRGGNVAEEIVAIAKECGADLLVIGTHGRTGATHFLLGSVAERVVRTSPVPVLTMRGSR